MDALFTFGAAIIMWTLMFVGVLMGLSGQLRLALLPIVVAPLGMYVVRQLFEYGQPDNMFDPTSQSWAFLFGDTIALPICFGAAAMSWRRLKDDPRELTPYWWLMSAMVIGGVLTLTYMAINYTNYKRVDYLDGFNSPSSIWHALAFLCLTYVFLAVCLPAIVFDFSAYGKWVLVSFVVWLALGVLDATVHDLDPRDLHPSVQDTVLAD